MKKFITIILLLSGAVAFSQSKDSIKTFNLNEVVVTGQYEPQSAKKSVYTVRTIPLEVIKARGAVKLEDVLNTELNIRFEQDPALGDSRIVMQGLQGQNVKILLDGVPMVGRQGTTNQINLNQININSIERIEIIQGPMSVVYGADALAGVINIITKKSSDGKLELSAKIQEETAGKEYGLALGVHNKTIGIGYGFKKYYFRGDFSRNEFGGWKGDSTFRVKAWKPKTQWLASGVAGIKTEKTNVYYRLDYTNEEIHAAGNFVGNEALDQNYLTTRFMHQVQASHTFSDRLSFNGAIAYTDFQRRTQSITVNKSTGDERLAIGAGLQDVTVFNGITARATFQYKVSDRFSLQPGLDIYQESGSGGRIKTGTQEIGDYAFFISGEWKISNVVSLRPGVRVIHNTVYNAPPAIPSLNAKIRVSDKHDLRISYGMGFRAPSLRELYFNFFDASHQIIGNPDLKAEQSQSFNVSWNYQVIDQDGLKLAIAPGAFYNSIENMIGSGPSPTNSQYLSYINIGKYRTQGVTLNSTLKMKKLDLALGLGYTGRYNQYFEDETGLEEFNWSPEVNSTASYRFLKAGLSLTLFYKYVGTLPLYFIDPNTLEPTLAKISAYQWADFSAQKTWVASNSVMKHITIAAGARNLFDVVAANSTVGGGGAHSTSTGPRPLGYGRSYFLSVSYLFNK